jgi:inorganic phosphate transporter, PiT family
MMNFELVLPIVSIVLGFLMAWGVGANDLANILSTSLGSKSITVRQAIIIAIIFELAGALFGSSHVSATLRSGIIDLNELSSTPMTLTLGMLSILVAGTFWINFASYYGLPVSITNAVVGSFVGFGAIVLGTDAIHWQQVFIISFSWLFAPILASVLAYSIFTVIQHTILIDKDPLKAAQRYFPSYLFLVGVILSVITLIKGLRHFHIQFNLVVEIAIVCASASVFVIISHYFVKEILQQAAETHSEKFVVIEKMFALLMACTACAMVFAHGSNDVAVAVGPLLVLETVWIPEQLISKTYNLPTLTIIFGVFGVITGLVFYGRKVITTVGSGITALTPSRAFAATFAAATIVVISTSTGLPVSATQTLVGAVLGVGLARGIGALNLVVMRNIIMSWAITLPVVSLLTIVCYEVLRYFIV